VDVLCGGFPCQDLSTAGSGAGLDGERSGLYREVVRFAGALRPEIVVLENVPGLLHYRARLDADWRALGYGLTWVRCRALDVGAPHIRARVFVVARRGEPGRGVIDAPDMLTEQARPWPTAMGADADDVKSQGPGSESLNHAARMRPWPTATAGDDSVRPDRHVAGELPWATPTASDARAGWTQEDAERAERRNLLGDQTGGKRLNPAFVEALMGFPIGWTETTGPALVADPSPRWPRGRYPADWDRSVPWPGDDWEPARTLPDGPPIPGRPARLRALGNAVVPAQGALAIRTAMAEPAQLALLSVASCAGSGQRTSTGSDGAAWPAGPLGAAGFGRCCPDPLFP
jgi:site-specific DNA-cytosine methylase